MATETVAAVLISRSNNRKRVGAAVYQRENRTSNAAGTESDIDTNELYYSLQLFEFDDNDQFSTLDTFVNQVGPTLLYFTEDFQDSGKGEGKKISNLLHGKCVETAFVKQSLYADPKSELQSYILKLSGKATHITNSMDKEMPLASSSLQCLVKVLQLVSDEEHIGHCRVHYGSLDAFMQLDSSASEAVNLLPKPDHPSQFGSLFGVLNRCRTKMGPRLLERWLRQPLTDVAAIVVRQDVVEVMLACTVLRNKLVEVSLKSVPDVDAIIRKMQRKGAGLEEVFRLYVLSRSLPGIRTLLADLVQLYTDEHSDNDSVNDVSRKTDAIRYRFLHPLERMAAKFTLYQQFTEQLLDFDRLPTLEVSAVHDPSLRELREERDQCAFEAQSLLREAQSSWAAFATVSLDTDPRNKSHGMVFRTTRGEDERDLRKNRKDVKILSILKNGVHFTTRELEAVSSRHRDADEACREKQTAIVTAAIETAQTYLPLAECVCTLLAELDVLTAFATAAAYAPQEYVRPEMLPADGDGNSPGVLEIQNARHPCVELMEGVQFVPNDYTLRVGESAFQIITGPNMGGKSTYIRGLGCLAVLAQVGSFVPCRSARMSVVDRVLARVGAGDAVQKGVSTFMAEMLEASVILNSATSRSIVIIDELGRGTSTYDGFGLAWGISEHISRRIGCFCLFASHFHELTALANVPVQEAKGATISVEDTTDVDSSGAEVIASKDEIIKKSIRPSGVVNKHVTGVVEGGEVIMLYTVRDGPCHESFGVHVAAMAQFPKRVIEESKRKAAQLESVTCNATAEITSGDNDSSKQNNKRAAVENAMQEFKKLPLGDVHRDAIQSVKSELQSIVANSITAD